MKKMDGVNVYFFGEPDWRDCFDGIKRRKVVKPVGNHGGKYKDDYIDTVCAFDTETSRVCLDASGNIGPEIYEVEELKKHGCRWTSFTYEFQFAFGNQHALICRTWDDFRAVYEEIKAVSREVGAKFVIYVHNLQYEFAGLKSVLQKEMIDAFFLDKRRIAKCMTDCVEFRCSYVQSNLALGTFIKQYTDGTHAKLGGYDYDTVRFPWTPLDDDEILYGVNDVIGLVEAITGEMAVYGDTLYTIPMTSTGYPRRDCKDAQHPNRLNTKNLVPPYEIHRYLEKAFRGGNTHANRIYSGETISGEKIHSRDRSSSYPDCIIHDTFPMSPFELHRIEENNTADRLAEFYYRRRFKCMLLHVFIFGSDAEKIKLRFGDFPDVYIATAKCESITGGVYDNGRVLEADAIELWCTDVDLDIIVNTYDFTGLSFDEVYESKRGKLPAALRNVFIELYKSKTLLKGVEGKAAIYNAAKAKINGGYGMMAQNPLRDSYYYCTETTETYLEQAEEVAYWSSKLDELEKSCADTIDGNTLEEVAEKLKKAVEKADRKRYENATRNPFVVYQWGVWCTAWARYWLFMGMLTVYNQGGKLIYWDTDSLKYTGVVDFTELNETLRNRAVSSGAIETDKKGNEHYIGAFEDEGYYNAFRTLGAKKYAYEDDDGLHVTIAGVNKKKGAKELGSLENMQPGFVFRDAGGILALYNTENSYPPICIEGYPPIEVVSNIVLIPSTYELSMDEDYMEMITEERVKRYLKPGKIDVVMDIVTEEADA